MEFINIRYLRGIPGLLTPFGIRIKVDNEAVRVIRFGSIKTSIPITNIVAVDVKKEKGHRYVLITFESEGFNNICVLQVNSYFKERTANKLANAILTSRQQFAESGKTRFTKQVIGPKTTKEIHPPNFSGTVSFIKIKTLFKTAIIGFVLLLIISIFLTPPSQQIEKTDEKDKIKNVIDSPPHSIKAKDELVEKVQKYLNALEINVGIVDGIYGPKTKSAIIEFQEKNKINTDGKVSKSLLLHLESALKEKESAKKYVSKKAEKPVKSTDQTPSVAIRNWGIGSIVSLRKNIGEGVLFATSESALKTLGDSVVSNDSEGFLILLANGSVVVLEDGTKARVLDTPLLGGWAKVRILEGDYNLWVGYVLMSP